MGTNEKYSKQTDRIEATLGFRAFHPAGYLLYRDGDGSTILLYPAGIADRLVYHSIYYDEDLTGKESLSADPDICGDNISCHPCGNVPHMAAHEQYAL